MGSHVHVVAATYEGGLSRQSNGLESREGEVGWAARMAVAQGSTEVERRQRRRGRELQARTLAARRSIAWRGVEIASRSDRE